MKGHQPANFLNLLQLFKLQMIPAPPPHTRLFNNLSLATMSLAARHQRWLSLWQDCHPMSLSRSQCGRPLLGPLSAGQATDMDFQAHGVPVGIDAADPLP